MKTESQLNQLQITPNGIAVEAVAKLGAFSDTPKIVPLKFTDGAKSVAEIVAEKTEGHQSSDVYLFIVPSGEPDATFPIPNQFTREQRMALYERLYRAGYGVEQIAKMTGHKSAAVVSLFMSRNGRSFTDIKNEMRGDDYQLLQG